MLRSLLPPAPSDLHTFCKFCGRNFAVAVFVFRMLTSNRVGETRDAIDILKERFAKGEIDKDEFEEKKRLLSD